MRIEGDTLVVALHDLDHILGNVQAVNHFSKDESSFCGSEFFFNMLEESQELWMTNPNITDPFMPIKEQLASLGIKRISIIFEQGMD